MHGLYHKFPCLLPNRTIMEKQLTFTPIHSNSPEYPFCERLYQTAFPSTERRNTALQRKVTDTTENFHFHALSVNGKTVGFLTFWEFPRFIYIEHFAIDATMRGQHIGQTVMEHFHKTTPKPIILEVERPDTDIARRRIGFYERCGYTLWRNDYLQPPYQEGQDFLPLYLMCNSCTLQADTDFETIKTTLYTHVYGLCND